MSNAVKATSADVIKVIESKKAEIGKIKSAIVELVQQRNTLAAEEKAARRADKVKSTSSDKSNG